MTDAGPKLLFSQQNAGRRKAYACQSDFCRLMKMSRSGAIVKFAPPPALSLEHTYIRSSLLQSHFLRLERSPTTGTSLACPGKSDVGTAEGARAVSSSVAGVRVTGTRALIDVEAWPSTFDPPHSRLQIVCANEDLSPVRILLRRGIPLMSDFPLVTGQGTSAKGVICRAQQVPPAARSLTFPSDPSRTRSPALSQLSTPVGVGRGPDVLMRISFVFFSLRPRGHLGLLLRWTLPSCHFHRGRG
jgi:hypothetical protein